MSATLKSSLRGFAARLCGFLGQQKNVDEFSDEVQQHFEMLSERFVAQGMSSADAARAARLQFGNPTLLQEDRRELQTLTSIEALWLDLRYAMRALWKSRAFAVMRYKTWKERFNGDSGILNKTFRAGWHGASPGGNHAAALWLV